MRVGGSSMDQVGPEGLSDRSQPKKYLREELREKAGELGTGTGSGRNGV